MKFLYRKLVYIIYLIAVFGLLMTYLAPYVNPEHFPIFSLFAVTQLFWFSANIIFLLYWAIFRRKYAIYSLLLLLIGWNHLMGTFNLTPKKKYSIEENQSEYQFAFFNTRVQSIYHTGNTTQKIAKYALDHNVDVFGLVEWLNVSENFANTDYPHQRFIPINPNKPKGFGLKFISRYKILDYKRIKYEFSSFNMAAYFDVEFPNQVVRIFVVHLQSNHISGDDYRIAKELAISEEGKKHAKFIINKIRNSASKRARQTQLILEEMENSPYPTIVMGDFNDTHLSFPYKKLRTNKKDCFLECGRGIGATFLKPKPFLRIDYILIDQEMHCLDYQTTDEIDSDHKLLRTKIAF